MERDGVRLMVMGTVQKGGGGCVCPENVLVRTLVSHLLLRKGEAMILDMEAGVEHLGRATASAVDQLIVVVEPGRRSLEVAGKIRKLAGDIGLKNICLVGNKVRGETDRKFRKTRCRRSLSLDFFPMTRGSWKRTWPAKPPSRTTPISRGP